MKKVFNYFLLLLTISASFSLMDIREDNNDSTEIISSTITHRSQFRRVLLTKNKLFVDKTMFIAALLTNTNNTEIILAPPKWGKSFNLEMTQTFFDVQYDEKGNSKPWIERDIYFKGGIIQHKIGDAHFKIILQPLEISKGFTKEMEQMGIHPVLFLSFKGFGGSYENFRKLTIKAIGDIIIKKKYAFLRAYCGQVFSYDKYCKYLLENPRKALENDYILEQSFYILSRVLSKHSGEAVVVLIDDYDYPLNDVISRDNDLYSVLNFQRVFFSNIQKQGQRHLYKFIIAGNLLNVRWKFLHSGSSAGIRSVEYYTVLDRKYSAYFGFTKKEIKHMLDKGKYTATVEDMEKWYGGYHIGNNKMYKWHSRYQNGYDKIHHPYSVSHCLTEGGTYRAHWLRNDATGLEDEYSPVDKLLHGLLLEDYCQKFLQELCYRRALETKIKKDVNFKTKLLYDELSSILTFLGYVTTSRIAEKTYEVMIPNQQIREFTLLTFKYWIRAKKCMKQIRGLENRLESIMTSLANGNVHAIGKLVTEILPQIDIAENNHCEIIFALFHYSPIPWQLNRTFAEDFGSHWDCIITLTPAENTDALPPVFVTIRSVEMTFKEWKRNFKEMLRKNEWPFFNTFLTKGVNITLERIIYDATRFIKKSFERSLDLKPHGLTSVTKTKTFVGVYFVERYKNQENIFKKLLNLIRYKKKESPQLLPAAEKSVNDESFF